MAIRLEPPPRGTTIAALERWLDKLFQFVRPSVQVVSDANASIGTGVKVVYVTALTAGRTLTLPATSELADGTEIVVQDASGAAGTYNITIQRAGSDTINSGAASVSITTNNGRKNFLKYGTKYFAT